MEHDAVVVGAGPNGLAAAIVLARRGVPVVVLEANETIGGAARSMELTLPGFFHDAFSGVYPLGIGSPFLSSLPLEEHGLEWVHPPAPLAHPFDDGTAAVLERSLDATAATLGKDGARYRRLLEPIADHWAELSRDVLAPLHIPRHPLLLARFGLHGIRPMADVARSFPGGRGAALLAGSAAHAGLPLELWATTAYGLVLNAGGHAVGWPFARGGSSSIPSAMASYLRSLGGEIRTGERVGSLEEIPPARVVLLNVTPRQFLRIAGDRLPPAYRRRLERYRYGPGVFKVDWALSGPVPWAAGECDRAGTVHLGGTTGELVESQRRPWRGEDPERPFVLFAQPSRFDPSRAPPGKHTAWAYCHVPVGSDVDMTERIEAQVERFAPGFRDLVLARATLPPSRLEELDSNLVGGDVNGGAAHLAQLFFRPVPSLDPYSTPLENVFLCSASTPPGGGVHGMCGYHAAQRALRRLDSGE